MDFPQTCTLELNGDNTEARNNKRPVVSLIYLDIITYFSLLLGSKVESYSFPSNKDSLNSHNMLNHKLANLVEAGILCKLSLLMV